MLALIGYIGAIPGRVWAVARKNPALKWALLALGVVVAVEVVAELGAKVTKDVVDAYKAASTVGVEINKTNMRAYEPTKAPPVETEAQRITRERKARIMCLEAKERGERVESCN